MSNSQPPLADLTSVSAQLKSLGESISSLYQPAPSPLPGASLPLKPHSSPILASTMTWDEIISLVH
jgi:hypothetical protein